MISFRGGSSLEFERAELVVDNLPYYLIRRHDPERTKTDD